VNLEPNTLNRFRLFCGWKLYMRQELLQPTILVVENREWIGRFLENRKDLQARYDYRVIKKPYSFNILPVIDDERPRSGVALIFIDLETNLHLQPYVTLLQTIREHRQMTVPVIFVSALYSRLSSTEWLQFTAPLLQYKNVVTARQETLDIPFILEEYFLRRSAT